MSGSHHTPFGNFESPPIYVSHNFFVKMVKIVVGFFFVSPSSGSPLFLLQITKKKNLALGEDEKTRQSLLLAKGRLASLFFSSSFLFYGFIGILDMSPHTYYTFALFIYLFI